MLNNFLNNSPFNPNGSSPAVLYVSARPSEKVTCSVYNISGQFLGELQSSFFSEKDSQRIYRFEWQGRNQQGVILTPGLYLFKFSIEEKTYVKKLIVLN